MANASETTARAFTDLLHLNRTSAKGYQEAADEVKSSELKSQLTQYAQQRSQFASQLEQQASQLGISAEDTNTVESVANEAAAAVHRGWINVKAAFTGNDDSSILGTCETGEESALKAYDTALQSNDINPSFKSVLEQQRSEIQSAKSWISSHK
ncbi:PA2169 family four-helix-bundle protein [Hymenobacter sp. RP-2-7]|uniref:PA2169 family four-helix-bundle protein n=1 Tax=Hymenobacter polaris TaxID=2682546 RepID=A0A7Y0FLW7_9BACT|nr:PA2169 family four-helix-bundle protein [Hymenobacter polaris]NML64814.1 PA2169 family four-helix-bundle protein [Hymenobacter polaris]